MSRARLPEVGSGTRWAPPRPSQSSNQAYHPDSQGACMEFLSPTPPAQRTFLSSFFLTFAVLQRYALGQLPALKRPAPERRGGRGWGRQGFRSDRKGGSAQGPRGLRGPSKQPEGRLRRPTPASSPLSEHLASHPGTPGAGPLQSSPPAGKGPHLLWPGLFQEQQATVLGSWL